MQAYLTLVRRELGMFFNSFTGYAVMGSVLLLLGYSFVDMLVKLNGTPTSAPMTELFYTTLYFWLILLLTAPVISMRSFAAERSSGTYETLMTAPVSDLQVVLAKFTGIWLFYLITWLPLAVCLWVVRYFTGEQVVFDVRTAASTYLGIGLIGALYMAMGCFASALTRSQVLAAMNAFALGLTVFLLGLRDLMPGPTDDWPARVFAYIAMSQHMELFSRGVVDTRPVFYYLSFTAFFLYLTLKVVESRRWK
jgi:ABC-2 type transport system permease protein